MEEKKTKKKPDVKQVVSSVATILLAVCILLAAASIVVQKVAGEKQLMVAGWGGATIVTGSMEPNVPVGSLILIHEKDEYEVGDIITYEGSGSRPVTHRVIMTSSDGTVVTKGDANNAKDDPINVSQIYGKVVAVIPGGGNAVAVMQSPVVLCVVVVLIGLIWLLPYKSTRKVEDENVQEECKQS